MRVPLSLSLFDLEDFLQSYAYFLDFEVVKFDIFALNEIAPIQY